MNRYVFYNNQTGDIKFIKRMTPQQAHKNCTVNHALNISCVAESELGYVLNKEKQKIDLDTMTLTAKTPRPVVPMAEIKQKRNMLLTASDWTQAADSPLSDAKKAEWRTYRQALRDVPADNPDAANKKAVNWPTPPA